MKAISIICLMITSMYLSGQAIDSLGCTGAVGDVKYSILNPAQFEGENGPCWVLMDGRTIVGSRLQSLITNDTVPDMRGYFIRSYDNRQTNRIDVDRSHGDPIAERQDDEIKSHNHAWSYNESNAGSGDSFGWFDDAAADPPRGTNTYTTTFTGGTESRPVNLTLWTYIRIN